MKSILPRLEVINLVRRFNERAVVNKLSLTLMPQQVICLLGPSGCGKSTTLRMIAGIEKQDEGSILMDGRVISDNHSSFPPEQRGIGFMFQDFALFPHLSVTENIAFGLLGSKDYKRSRVTELLRQVDLLNFAESYPHQLSGGEQQRVALARALAPRPRIMLMDEPFSGLDNRLRDGIRDQTLDLLKAEDTSVLLVTHEPDEAMRMADKIALMRDGQIVQIGTPYHVYTKPVDHAAVAFFSDTNVLRATVEGSVVNTSFGRFSSLNLPNKSNVEIVFRPQHVRLDFDRNGTGPLPTESDGMAVRGIVERARFMGNESLVEFQIDSDGSILRATIPGVFVPEKGRVMWLTVRRDRCFVFPA